MSLGEVFNDLRKIKTTLYNDSKYALELAVQLQNKDITGFANQESLESELVALLESINKTVQK